MLCLSLSIPKLAFNNGQSHHTIIRVNKPQTQTYNKFGSSNGIKYSNSQRDKSGDTEIFQSFTNAPYANTDKYKSTAGDVFFAEGGAITACSKT